MAIEDQKLEQYIQNDKYTNFALEPLSSDLLSTLSKTHRNSFYQIIIIRKGQGHYFIDFEKYEISAPAICFIFPQQIYKLELSEDAEGDVIMFDKTIFCSAILENELKEYNVDLHKKINFVDFTDKVALFETIHGIKDQIERQEKPLNNIRKIEIKFLTKIIIFKIIDASSMHEFSGLKDRELEIYLEFRRLVDTQFMHNRKVESYCDKLGVSAKKLNTLCKRYSHTTALEIIHERLSLEIKKIFIFEDVPLKEIAYTLGFDSQSALNKYIASKFDCTPSQLKEKVQSNYDL